MRNRMLSCLVSVLLCFSVFLPVFSTSVSAAVSNLVPTDMRQWEAIEPIGDSTITYVDDIKTNHIIFTPENNLYFVGLVKDVDYIAGHTYNLTFGSTYNHVSHITWGFGYRTSDDTFQYLSSSNLIQSENKMSFVAPDTVNSVYVIFEFDGATSQTIQINHLLCVDVTASEQQAVIDNQNQNAQDIKDNADKNAQEIKDNADENTSKIGGWLSELGDKIKSIFVIEDYIYPSWVSRSVTLATGNVGGYRSSDAVTSDFIVPLCDMTVTNDGLLDGELSNGINLLIYNLDGSYVGYRNFTVSENLSTSYKYRIHLRDSALFNYTVSSDDNESLTEYMNEHLVIKSEVTVFEKLFQDIINGLKSLFIPSDESLQDFKDNCSSLMEDHFGLAYSAGEIVTGEFTAVFDILADNDGDFSFTLPALDFDFLDYDIHLWDEVEAPFEEIMEIDAIDFLYSVYKVLILVIFAVTLIKYGIKVFDEVFSS